MTRQLPFLNGLRAFEAAARHGGFAGAATELHVSPGAISRMVRLLEQRLAVPLFERRANHLRLTPAGERYRDGLAGILDELEALTARLRAEAGQQVLTIGVGPSFSTHWLIPRLADWYRRHPEIAVRVTSGGAAAAFDEAWSCGIRLGEGVWPGLSAMPLFEAELRPVCAPALAARLTGAGDLDPALMLRVAHAPGDWPAWLARHGPPALAARGPVFDFYGQAQQAAMDGLGVALGLRPYIDDALRAGRLVAPLPGSVPKQGGWFLLHRPERMAEPAFRAFRDWILEAAAAG